MLRSCPPPPSPSPTYNNDTIHHHQRQNDKVAHETEVTFEYQVRDKAERVALGLKDNANGTLFSPTVTATTPVLSASGGAATTTAQGFLPFQARFGGGAWVGISWLCAWLLPEIFNLQPRSTAFGDGP